MIVHHIGDFIHRPNFKIQTAIQTIRQANGG
jgi:hypothetical protein